MAEKVDEHALEALLSGCKTPQDVAALYTQMLQRVIDRGLSAELDAHLGYERHEKSADGERRNTRNGATKKRLKGTFGALEVTTPRDRAGTFEPQLVKKRQTRLGDFEDKILALYARGMSTRDIESALVDLYGVTVSHDVIAQVTDAVLDEVRAWQERPLEAVYPVIWLDGLVLKARHGKQVANRCAHVALGLNLRGEKEVLGVWIAESEGAKFWASVLSELKARGVQDIYIACMDGLKGLPEAVTALFPRTLTQQCIVHLIRASMRYVAAKDMKAVAAALRRIYTSASIEDAAGELDAFEETWGGKYRAAVRVWRNAWDNVVPFFQFPPEIRKITYTTNAIESLNMTMRKYTRNRRIFPNDESAMKSLYLAIREASKRWRGVHHWKQAMQTFQILFGEDRVPVNA
ncbi:MAG: IS256 family transposase [Caldilineaceae bacterium]|nr:IS256 family transposase [Caldilineaceae bacterium]MCB0122211.1 IS256 family transposase [Caldilineaceae bacterium]